MTSRTLLQVVTNNVYASLECGSPEDALWELNAATDTGCISTEQRCDILESVEEQYEINLNDY